jgi:hypothetical protein
MDTSSCTPRKGRKSALGLNLCVACGLESVDARNLSNDASKVKTLPDLICKYGGIRIEDGYLLLFKSSVVVE